jgi:hypothetical protein
MMACAMLTRRWLSAESLGVESLEGRRMALRVSLFCYGQGLDNPISLVL